VFAPELLRITLVPLETKTGGESLFWKEATDGGVTTMFLWHGMPAKIQQILANAGHNMARVAVN
jgi:hypothetical protein